MGGVSDEYKRLIEQQAALIDRMEPEVRELVYEFGYLTVLTAIEQQGGCDPSRIRTFCEASSRSEQRQALARASRPQRRS